MPTTLACPRCGDLTAWENNPCRPFCSERCKLIDLGAWASEEYRVPVQEQDSDPLSASEAAPGTPRSN